MTGGRRGNLPAYIDGPARRRSRPVDRDVPRLAEQLSAVRVTGPCPRWSAETRAMLVAAAVARQEPEPDYRPGGGRSRLRLWIGAVAAAVAVAGAGVASAGGPDVDVPPRPPRTYGPVSPQDVTPATDAPGNGGPAPRSMPPTPGGGRSTAPGRTDGGGAAPPVSPPAPSTSPAASGGLCLDVLGLLKVCP